MKTNKSADSFTYLAHPLVTLFFVAVVAAVVLAVASPPGRDAFTVSTFELGLGALTVLILAHRVRLVATVPAIVGEVAQPLLRHASIIGTLKVHLGVALRTVLRTLVGPVATVVLAVAEQPLRDAPVVRVSRTPLPSSRAVLLPTHIRRLVTVVAAIVVGVAHPQLGNALAVLTAELGAWIAGTVV